ncbi:MAG TPA: (E)-4-hydroxy-3-methylbut-2-enyl-diphosphate synthase [Chitinophagaceae bacterium]|jgi:(E)-4-hydroxy-3-methylbut-2-enyl-diphosphate synthase|nr:(E)-4-hydroxy-3-methylbut-2-enyl-diphosphate synthase [Chitinophagaceae bacterium]
MQFYSPSLTSYQRLKTREVKIGNLILGGNHPIRIQTMTTTDTMDTLATVEQTIRCIDAGAELVRITAPSKNEAENLQVIKNELNARGYHTPLVADIHFTPNAAEIAARIIEKVRVNPGNYVDKKKFEQIEYTDEEYLEEIERIRERFTPLVLICKEHETAMRIGTNHGSLSDRIMSRYGDTAIGMVESAMEFLRIARSLDYHQIVLSMKSSNPQVMVQAYRLLVQKMTEEFDECYPLHLGVTEAGDGEDGRIKSAIGIGTLLADGIGDTIRVSLTEDPEFELPVCKDIISTLITNASIQLNDDGTENLKVPPIETLPYSPFEYKRVETQKIKNIGGNQVPVVVADISKIEHLNPEDLKLVGYHYSKQDDKWTIGDMAADYLFVNHVPEFALPGTLGVICYPAIWLQHKDNPSCYPIFEAAQYVNASNDEKSKTINFIMLDAYSNVYPPHFLDVLFHKCKEDKTAVLCLSSLNSNSMQSIRRLCMEILIRGINNPVIIISDSNHKTLNEALVHYSVDAGGLLLDGFLNGICLGYQFGVLNNGVSDNGQKLSDIEIATLNSISFGILQATRTRISKTEYISCPSCGRTLFDLQETTAKIRAVTNHLKGVKIAIMGCIVNGPGEMADADFGYVGSGIGKITLYKSKEVVKRNIDSEVAVDELINLLKEHGAWVDPKEIN